MQKEVDAENARLAAAAAKAAAEAEAARRAAIETERAARRYIRTSLGRSRSRNRGCEFLK